MPLHQYSRQHPDIGRVALRLRAIPVLALVLVVSYVALRPSQGEPAALADIATKFQAEPSDAGLPPAAETVWKDDGAEVRDPSADSLELLDPVGAGRYSQP